MDEFVRSEWTVRTYLQAKHLMETVIYEDSPLAAYLEGQSGRPGKYHQANMFKGEGGEQVRSVPGHEEDEPASPASTSFAPRGKPTVRLRFQHKLPSPLRLAIPENTAAASAYNTCSVSRWTKTL